MSEDYIADIANYLVYAVFTHKKKHKKTHTKKKAALVAVVALLNAQTILTLETRECEEVLELIAEAATHCRFEASADDTDELVLAKILELLRCTLEHPVGAKLEDETVYGMVQTCLRLSMQARFSGLLRRTAEQAVTSMVCTVFGRNIEALGGAVQSTQAVTEVSGALSDEGILQRILQNIMDSERPELESSVAGVVNTQRVQFSRENNTVKKMLESGLSVCCKLFKLMCSLLDRTKNSNNDASVLLGTSVIQAVLLRFGSDLEVIPGLVALVQDDLFHFLLQNLLTDNFLVLTGTLSVTRNLFVFLTRHIKLQMELVINKAIEWIMCDGVPYQKQEITLEFLVDLFRLPWFMAELYVNYDCDPNCTDLFEKIAVFLYKNSYPPDGALYTSHVLALEGLLAVATAVADRIRRDSNSHSRGTPIDAELVRRRKQIKRHLLQGAKDFNEKRKDERYAYLQSVGLLPTPLTPAALARFFRITPNLDKTLVGEVLGGNKEFELQVLEEYLGTFKMSSDFLGVLRTFLESFKIPGEAQIIQRVLERFAHHFYEAHKDEGVFGSEDAVFLLAYAMLILHVDNHSEKIVNKMREAQFKKSLRGTNGTKDFPDEMLSQIYFSVSTHEIKIYEDYFEGPITPMRWKGLQKRSKRFAQYYSSSGGQCDRDIFTLMWGRIIAAIGVVFNNSYNNEILSKATEGFKLCAEISAHFAMSDVVDNLIVTLCKYSHLLVSRGHNSRINPLVAFASSDKAQMATSLVFAFTRAYGNHLREGWRNIVDAILNLHAVRLLQVPQLFSLPQFLEPPVAVPAAQKGSRPELNNSGSGIFSIFSGGGWFGGGGGAGNAGVGGAHVDDVGDSEPRLLSVSFESERAALAGSLEAGGAVGMRSPSPHLNTSPGGGGAGGGSRPSSAANSSSSSSEVVKESQDVKIARECISKCHIDEIIAGAAKLQHDSLVYLVKALILGSVRSHAVDFQGTDTPGPGDSSFSEGASQLCLDLLTQITLLNEQRILMIWVLVYEHMADIVASELSPRVLVLRTLNNLLLLCASLISQPEITERLLRCLQSLVGAANERCGQSPLIAYKFGAALLHMVAVHPTPFLTSDHGWNTAMLMARFAVRSPESASSVTLAMKLIVYYSGMDSLRMLEIERSTDVAGIKLLEVSTLGSVPKLDAARWRDVLEIIESICKPSFSKVAEGQASVSSSALVEAVSVLEVLYACSGSMWEGNDDAVVPAATWAPSIVGGSSPALGSPVAGRSMEATSLDRSWSRGWQPVLSILCDLCSHRQSLVRNAALTAMQHLLLSNVMRAATPVLWRLCFKSVLFPMLEQLAASRKAGVDQQKLEGTRIRAFAAVHKIFLIYLPLLRALDDFEQFWGHMLDVNERFLQLPGGELSEAVPESLKNVLLVLIDDHLLQEDNALWKYSFERIDRFCPNMRRDLAEIMSVKQPAATAAEPK